MNDMYKMAAEEAFAEGKKKGLSGDDLEQTAKKAIPEILIRIQVAKDQASKDGDIGREEMEEGIREAAKEAGYEPDSLAFREVCKDLVGRRRLSEMSDAELVKLRKGLGEQATSL
jgi:hypothetical protein